MYMYIQYACTEVFLISKYGTTLAQRTSYLALHNSLFGTDGTVNCDILAFVEPIWPMLQNVSKTLMYIIFITAYTFIFHYQICTWTSKKGHGSS